MEKPYQKIKLTDEQIEIIKPIIDDTDDAWIAFKLASNWIRQVESNLFECIGEIVPEAAGKKCSISKDTNEVIIWEN